MREICSLDMFCCQFCLPRVEVPLGDNQSEATICTFSKKKLQIASPTDKKAQLVMISVASLPIPRHEILSPRPARSTTSASSGIYCLYGCKSSLFPFLTSFCFDEQSPRHQTYVNHLALARRPKCPKCLLTINCREAFKNILITISKKKF